VTPAPDRLPALADDLRRCLDAAPIETREDRFEAWVWRAMLAEYGPAMLTKPHTPAHVTASAVVIDPAGARTCLVLHGKLGLWVQPGGHIEPTDTSIPRAAAREAREETGLHGLVLPGPLRLARHPAPCGVPGADWHLDVQHVLVADPLPPTVSDESHDVAWFDVEDLPEGTAPGVHDAVRRAADRVRAGSGRGVAPAPVPVSLVAVPVLSRDR
jgi:8-oxo-dGTP pyrophosphatase MutT (NUDIX family)